MAIWQEQKQLISSSFGLKNIENYFYSLIIIMKTWGRDVCVERAEGCWDGQGKGFINSPKKRGETTPSAKAGGVDPTSSYPKYPQHLQQAAGESLLHTETSGTSKKPQEASPNDEDGVNQGLHPKTQLPPS